MCGIAAIFANSPEAPPVNRDELLRIREQMTARGPDGCGLWLSPDGRVGLAHRRLAIIELTEGGAQPMSSSDGRLMITFNGEIYNFRELREGLEARGRTFRSNSDTEVLLQLYAERGPEMLNDLRGMFAFAIWDAYDNSLFLARDPFGIKPLYYADDGRTIRVASQVKALLAGGRVNTSPEPAGHVGFFLWGSVPEPYTLYRGIRSLPAGSYLIIPTNLEQRTLNLEPSVFCSIPREMHQAAEKRVPLSRDQIHERLRAAMLDTVRHHLIADVPVGVFLSSGLDSTTLAALTAEVAPGALHTVTLGFREFTGTADDEVPLAEEIARIYGARHRTVQVERWDFQEEFRLLLDAMDQPSTDGVNSYFVCKAAQQAGLKVVLSGLGGDELFGSYPGFRQIPRLVRSIHPFDRLPAVGRGFRLLSAPLMKHLTSPKYAGLLEYGGSYGGAYLLRRGMYMPWELPGVLDGEMVREGWNELQTLMRLEDTACDLHTPHLKISALEMCWYMRSQLLRDTDWASMTHSLEVRVPLVDLQLLREVVPLLCQATPIDKKNMARTPTKPLPDAVMNRGKSGFTVPVREWLGDSSAYSGERGLRGWARKIYKDQASGLRVLVLVTDAFGGRGGIAKFNRDFITALCDMPHCERVVAIPRLMPDQPEDLPTKLTYVTSAVNSKYRYVKAVREAISHGEPFDLIFCGHINLLPLAYLCHWKQKTPLGLIIHGIDAWQATGNLLVDRVVGHLDFFISVSQFTKQRFLGWTGLDADKGYILPNCVEVTRYGPGPKSTELLKRYGLDGKTVIMTLGRLVSQERYKGFDEVLDILPELAVEIPSLAYLIVGDGNDRSRLEQKVEALGVADRVVFAGFIQEGEKADHYRLADAYVMPSRGEGFGIVYLEAMACGIPVIASMVDGSREAVLNGDLGSLVDPSDRDGIKNAIRAMLQSHDRKVPPGLDHFSFDNFSKRLQAIVTNKLNPVQNFQGTRQSRGHKG